MILDVLVFALGFLVAGLLALAALPAVWRRALRLTEERLSRLVPLSPDEIAAERDHLRAAHALAQRRLEQRLELSEADRAALRVEAGRREGRILALDGEAVRGMVKVAALEAGAAALRRELDGLWAENGAEALALHGLTGLAEARLADIAALQADRGRLEAERDGLRGEVDRGRGSLAGLETRLLGAEARHGDLERDLAAARRDAAAATERATVLEGERDALRAEAARERRRLSEVEAALAAARAAAPEGGRPAVPAEDDRADEASAAKLRDIQIEHLKTELAFMAEQAASAERRATASAKAFDALVSERPAPVARRDAGQADLRRAIAALADDVLRATEQRDQA